MSLYDIMYSVCMPQLLLRMLYVTSSEVRRKLLSNSAAAGVRQQSTIYIQDVCLTTFNFDCGRTPAAALLLNNFLLINPYAAMSLYQIKFRSVWCALWVVCW